MTTTGTAHAQGAPVGDASTADASSLASPAPEAGSTVPAWSSEGTPTAPKKVVFYSLVGLSVASLALTGFSALKAQSAVAEHNDMHRNESGVIDCRTPEECGRLGVLRHDANVWMDRALAFSITGVALGFVGVATQLLWPHQRTTKTAAPTISPAVGAQDISLSVGGRF